MTTLTDLVGDDYLTLEHRLDYYDYLHDLRFNFKDGTFEMNDGGGQCINYVFKGTFTDKDNVLTLTYKQSHHPYANNFEGVDTTLPKEYVKKMAYGVRDNTQTFFDGYCKYTAKYKIVFDRDPFYYGVENKDDYKPLTLFNMLEDHMAKKDTNIFYTHTGTMECDVKLERDRRNVRAFDFEKLNKLSYFTTNNLTLDIPSDDKLKNFRVKLNSMYKVDNNCYGLCLVYYDDNTYVLYYDSVYLVVRKGTVDKVMDESPFMDESVVNIECMKEYLKNADKKVSSLNSAPVQEILFGL
jgi:hypothetical protein